MPVTRARDFAYGAPLQLWEWLYHLEALLDVRERALAEPWDPYGLEWRRRVAALLEAAFSGTSYHEQWTAAPSRAFDAPPPAGVPSVDVERARTLLLGDPLIAERAYTFVRDLVPGSAELTVPAPRTLRGDGWVVTTHDVARPTTGNEERSAHDDRARSASDLEESIQRALEAAGFDTFRNVLVGLGGATRRFRADFVVDVPGFGRTLIEAKRSTSGAFQQLADLAQVSGVAEALVVLPVGSEKPAISAVPVVTVDELVPYLRGRSRPMKAQSKVPVSPADLSPLRAVLGVGALFAVALAAGSLALLIVGLLDVLWRAVAVLAAVAVVITAAAGVLVLLAPYLDRASWRPLSALRRLLGSQFLLLTVATAVGTLLASLILRYLGGAIRG